MQNTKPQTVDGTCETQGGRRKYGRDSSIVNRDDIFNKTLEAIMSKIVHDVNKISYNG